MLQLTIGTRHSVNVKDAAEASAVYAKLRDASGEGFSTWPQGTLSSGARISYNAKVWHGDKLIFDPYRQE